jgi:hypothetical protein
MAKLDKPIVLADPGREGKRGAESSEIDILRADLERARVRETALKQKIADMVALSETEITRISEHTERLVKRLTAAELALCGNGHDNLASTAGGVVVSPTQMLTFRAWLRRIFVRRPRRVLVRLGLIR